MRTYFYLPLEQNFQHKDQRRDQIRPSNSSLSKVQIWPTWLLQFPTDMMMHIHICQHKINWPKEAVLNVVSFRPTPIPCLCQYLQNNKYVPITCYQNVPVKSHMSTLARIFQECDIRGGDTKGVCVLPKYVHRIDKEKESYMHKLEKIREK